MGQLRQFGDTRPFSAGAAIARPGSSSTTQRYKLASNYLPAAFLTSNVTAMRERSPNSSVTGTRAPGLNQGAGFMHIRWYLRGVNATEPPAGRPEGNARIDASLTVNCCVVA